MTKRELTDKHSGQLLGRFWPFVHPLLLIGIYVFVFGFVFRVTTGVTTGASNEFTIYLLAGLIPWLAMADTMNKGSGVLVANANLVKQVVFPLEILTAKTVFAALAVQLIYSATLLGYVLFREGSLPWTAVLVPVLIALQLLGTIGLVSVLSAIGVFFRDLKEFTHIFSTIGIYLLPVLYLPEMIPSVIRPALYANPFSHMAWCYQDAWFYGRFEHPWAWVVYPTLCLGSFAFGSAFFRKIKHLLGGAL